jgi:hypothetical protein
LPRVWRACYNRVVWAHLLELGRLNVCSKRRPNQETIPINALLSKRR